jgi:hypothetical protein
VCLEGAVWTLIECERASKPTGSMARSPTYCGPGTAPGGNCRCSMVRRSAAAARLNDRENQGDNGERWKRATAVHARADAVSLVHASSIPNSLLWR